MNVLLILLIVLAAAAAVLLVIAGVRHNMNFERSLNMVFLKIMIPRKETKEEKEKETEAVSSGKGDFKETVGVAKQLFDALHSIHSHEAKHYLVGQDFFSFEYAVLNQLVHFYIVIPRHLENLIEKQITAFYPDAYIERQPDYNIFTDRSHVFGSYMKLTKGFLYPIRTYQRMNADPLNTILNAFSKIKADEGAALQIMIRPRSDGWQERGRKVARKIFEQKREGFLHNLNPISWIGALINLLVHGPTQEYIQVEDPNKKGMIRATPVTEEQVKSIEEKNTSVGFETIIRVITAAPTKHQAYTQWVNLKSAFAQYATTENNQLSYTKHQSLRFLVTNFIFRHFRRPWVMRLTKRMMVLSSEELASLFHLPSIKYNRSTNIAWQNFKIAPAPSDLPADGLLLGYNVYRGETREVRLRLEDRFRHFYVIGQTGTGKSSILQVMIRQDLQKGNGLCVVDPHGQLIEDILPFIPRERADDVIYFDPADMERPMGLNLLEAATDEERDLVALDAMNIMIKLFNEEIFGPRIQDYFRNGCLTLMADPEGAALTDIVRLFTDDAFQKVKVEKVKNPVVKSFWTNQMAKTGLREKQEMIPYFAAKFGQFITNTMMRNIIGQSHSAFNLLKVMQEGKILLMNLSKGVTGEINSKLLGMIIVQKLQMAALARQRIAKDERRDFFLYIDEFQNYVTESIETILSEARKYRLSMNMAHQYLAQLEEQGNALKKGQSKVKDAVFGNVGTMMCYKISAQDAEYMAKEYAPVFSDQDLINMDRFRAVMKLSIDGKPSRPFSIVPVNPYAEPGDREAAEAFKQLSRLKYGRDKEFVEREILRRMGVQ